MSAKRIDGNILMCAKNGGYIAHQCNCVTKRGKGLSALIFGEYPDANIYADGTPRRLGDVIVRGNVCNLVGQIYPGGPSESGSDDYSSRKAAFATCLEKLNEMIDKKSTIAFPYKIGCGLAKGDWNDYENMIEDFANGRSGETLIIKLV